jgi:DNA ligase-1
MNKLTETIILEGGEGAILRKPHSYYESGRSLLVLKSKKSRDGEALIVAVRGIYVMCKLPNGRTFVINNSKSKTNYTNLEVGNVVTYKCLHFYHNGLPKYPSLFRKREDVKWEEVLASEKN